VNKRSAKEITLGSRKKYPINFKAVIFFLYPAIIDNIENNEKIINKAVFIFFLPFGLDYINYYLNNILFKNILVIYNIQLINYNIEQFFHNYLFFIYIYLLY